MARSCPQRLCGRMCQEWQQRYNAESTQTTVDTGRLSCGYHNWLELCAFLGRPEIFNTITVDGSHGFSRNCDEQICLCQWGILHCLPVRRRFCCCTRRLRCHRKVRLCHRVRHCDVPRPTWHTFHPSMLWVWRHLVVYNRFSVDLTAPWLPGLLLLLLNNNNNNPGSFIIM